MPAHHTLRILHLSDLHERGPREREAWRRSQVLGETWERNLDTLAAAGSIDLVCFTGDAADWGQPAEYQAACGFFQALMQRLKLPMERLFLVPGNHDIDRSLHEDTWQSLRQVFRQGDGLTLSRWLAGTGAPPPDAPADGLEQVLARQAAYRQWLQDLGRAELDPARHAHQRLGYRATPKLPGLPFPLHIIGLDTAWLSGDDEDAQKLWLTDDQIMRHATGPDGKPLPGLRIALCHHPLWDLADPGRSANLLAQHTDVLLRGHLHNATLERRADPDRGLLELAAGCLYEGHCADQYPNGCQLITLELNAQGRPLSVAPWFRTWSQQGHWYDDDSRYAASHQGRLVWPCLPPRPVQGGNPYDFAHPAVPPHFVGRVALLDSLAQALERTESISLLGDRRIGKSSVLLAFQTQAQAMGREVRLLSGEGAEAASLPAFIAAITSTPCGEGAEAAADALSAWAERTGRPGIAPLLLLDEAEIFLSQFEYRFFERLRGMLERLCVMLATHIEIDLFFRQKGLGSPFDNKLRIERVGLLEPEAAETLLRRGGNGLAGEDLALMRSWAGRHPYYLQVLGFRLVEARRLGHCREWALDHARQDGFARLRTLWASLSEKERQALRQAAAGQASRHSRLRLRGLLEENGLLFGQVLAEWLEEEGGA
jgi:predicted phosphodiesterase